MWESCLGRLKITKATRQSYIQYLDIGENKLRSLISASSSQSPNHQQIICALADFACTLECSCPDGVKDQLVEKRAQLLGYA